MLVFKNKHFLEIVQKPFENKGFCDSKTLCFQLVFEGLSKSVCFCKRIGSGNRTVSKVFNFDSENDTLSKVPNSDGAEPSKKMLFEK